LEGAVGQRTVGDELGVERGGGTADKELALLNVILPRDVNRPLLELLKSLKHTITRQYLYIPSKILPAARGKSTQLPFLSSL
jgi:hypothetical protein